jgi:hypothetical protein
MKGGSSMDNFKNLSKEKMYFLCIMGRFSIIILQAVSLFFVLVLKYINIIEFIVINLIMLVIQIILIKKQSKLTE